jgi:hypothetical protein
LFGGIVDLAVCQNVGGGIQLTVLSCRKKKKEEESWKQSRDYIPLWCAWPVRSEKKFFTGFGGAKAALGLGWKFLRREFVMFVLGGFGFSMVFSESNFDENVGKLVGTVGS